MMTGLVSAGAPLPTTTTLLEGGETVDPSGGETFLAALAAAVAVPAPTPAPSPMMIVVVEPDAMPPSDDAALDASDEADVSLTATALPRDESRGEDESAPQRITGPTDAPSSSAPLDVRHAEKAREAKSHAADAAGSPEPPARTESAESRDRADAAVPADADVRPRTPGQGDAMVPAPATPSTHASVHALAAPARQHDQGGEPPAEQVPTARPSATAPSSPASMRQPAPSASATAAGVLAAMHAARESASLPSSGLSGDVVAPVAISDRGALPNAAAVVTSPEPSRATPPPLAEPLQVPASEAPLGEPVVTRPVGVVAAGGDRGAAMSREQGQSAERDRPQQAVVVASPEAAVPLQAPFGAATVTSAEARPTSAEIPNTMPATEAPPARVATSHVSVELDLAQSGAERVRVAVRGDVVHATVVTDRGGVDAMRPQLDQLRHALEGQGFREAHVQVRSSGEAAAPMAPGGVAEFRPRADGSSRTADGSAPEQQPRGRQRGQDQSPPESRHHDHEEEIL